MGKLRDSLDKLKSALVSLETNLKEAEIKAAKLDTNLNQRFEAGLKAGVEMLYLYLVEKFKKTTTPMPRTWVTRFWRTKTRMC